MNNVFAPVPYIATPSYTASPSTVIYPNMTAHDYINDYKLQKEALKIRKEQELALAVQNAMQAPWNTPLPLQQGPQLLRIAPIVPQCLRDSPIYKVANNFASTTHDTVGVLHQILGAISIATHGRVDIQVNGGWVESTSLMIVQANEPGTQKSRLISQLRKPFDDFLKEKQEDFEKGLPTDAIKLLKRTLDKEHKAGLSKIIKESTISHDVIERCLEETEKYTQATADLDKMLSSIRPRILVDTTSSYGLRKILSQQGESCGCLTAESDLLNSLLLKKNRNVALVNKLYNQEPYESTVRNSPSLKRPAFTMVSFIQPSLMTKLFTDSELNELGTTARLLPFFHRQRPYQSSVSFFDSSEASSRYENVIQRMLNLYYTQDTNATRYTVVLEPSAIEELEKFRQEVSRRLQGIGSSKAESTYRKLHGQAARLAWAIHAWNDDQPHTTPITKEEMVQATHLCHMLIPHIDYAYSPTGLQAYDNAIKIIQNLRKVNFSMCNGPFGQEYTDSRTIQSRTNVKAEQVNNALDLLQQCNWIRIIDSGSRSNIVILNPYFMTAIFE